jgi:tetratricopeptide (TPR) repeat protein
MEIQGTTETPVQSPPVRPTLEQMLNKYKKPITYLLGGLIVLILGFFAFKYFYLQPQEDEAQVKIFRAQRYFDMDSMNYALNGDKHDMGFLSIADEYGMTKAGKLANYYAGLILLQKGKYEEAIEHLKKFNLDSKIIAPMALGSIGDAYSQLKNYDNAAKYYMDAAKKDDNKFTAPRYYKKAGLAYEELKQYKDAVEAYQAIKDKFAGSFEGNMIDKYIQRAQAELDNEK